MADKQFNLNSLWCNLDQAYKQLHLNEPYQNPSSVVEIKVQKFEEENGYDQEENHSGLDPEQDEYNEGYPYNIDEYSEESVKLGSQQLNTLDAINLQQFGDMEEVNQPCSICLLTYQEFPQEQLRVLPCEHFFHKSCVDVWLKDKPKCPKCKFDLREYL